MKRVLLLFSVGLALACATTSTGAADDQATAPTAPAATSPAAAPATTPVATTPACAVAGPSFDDRREPLRTALPRGNTLIVLSNDERKALPDPLPRAISKYLDALGARIAPLAADGSTGGKSMWRRDRRAKGRLHVWGKRLDAPVGRFHAVIDRTYGGKRYSPFVPGTLNFSTTGCWRIKARAGQARVTYVVLVRRPAPGEFAPYLP